MDIITLLLQHIDLPSVLLAIGITQLIRRFLPTPKGEGKYEVNSKIYRILPFFPIIIAIVITILKEGIITPSMKIDDAIVKGILSGFAAAWGYKTAKVLLFGKKGNGNNNNGGEK